MRDLKNRQPVFVLTFSLILAVLLFFTAGNAAQTKQKVAATPNPAPTPQPDKADNQEAAPAIPLSQIVILAEELRIRIDQLSERLSLSPEPTTIEQQLRSNQQSIEAQQRDTEELLATPLNLVELGELDKDWESLERQNVTMNETLAANVKTAEDDTRYLDDRAAQWETTLNLAQEAPKLESVLKKARDSLTAARNIQPKLNEYISSLLTMQKQAFQQGEVIRAAREKIALARQQFRRGILEADSPPLWKLPSSGQIDQTLKHILNSSLRLDWVRAKRFFRANPVAVLTPPFLFLVLLITSLRLRRRVSRWKEKYPQLTDSFDRLNHPFSLSLLLVLTATLLVIAGWPALFKSVLLLLSVIPILQYAPALIAPAFRTSFSALVSFALMMSVWDLAKAAPIIELSVMAILTLLAILVIGWLTRRGERRLTSPRRGKDRFILFAINIGLLLLVLSLLGNIFGYVRLAQLIRSGAVLGAYYAVALFAVATCITEVVSVVWGMRRDRAFSTLRKYEHVMAKWGRRLLVLSAIIIWLSATLKLFAVREIVLGALTNFLTSNISLGAVSFSLGDILIFILLFILGIAVAKVVGAILQEDLLVKFHLQQGLPYAISTIVYYVLLLAGFLFALAAAGVELSRFTLLTGAFGVGAGFGMQNILNNFISGIILLFERPIRAGDIAEVGTSIGTVEKIGSRSSKLRNWQGATVIVPNSTLISDQVINWSLVGEGRRIELRFKTDFGADPEQVIKLLASAAAAHPDVLPSPPPLGLFLGYGESTLDFELRFWSPLDILPELQSEVALKVSAALSEAGIKVPLPQRELLVRRYESSISKSSSEPEAEK